MRFGTLNIQRVGSMKVNMLADLMDDHTCPLDFLAVQELELPAASVECFCDALRQRHVHVFLGKPANTLYRTALLAKRSGASVEFGSDRAAGACFELLSNGSFTKFVGQGTCNERCIGCDGMPAKYAGALGSPWGLQLGGS